MNCYQGFIVHSVSSTSLDTRILMEQIVLNNKYSFFLRYQQTNKNKEFSSPLRNEIHCIARRKDARVAEGGERIGQR
jgi:hypothetical protein